MLDVQPKRTKKCCGLVGGLGEVYEFKASLGFRRVMENQMEKILGKYQRGEHGTMGVSQAVNNMIATSMLGTRIISVFRVEFMGVPKSTRC